MPTAPPRPSPIYNALIFVLGALAAYLLLMAGLVLPYIVAVYTFGAVVLVLLGFSLSGPRGRAGGAREPRSSRGWLSLSMGVLGFGVGALVFVHRLRFRGVADKLQLRIDTVNGAFLAGLMFLGFIMGFYVVRNWLKEEEEFVKSLTAVAGVAFLASILGLAQGGGQNNGQQPLNFMSAAFANYFLGFTFSAFVNLLVYGALTASYSATASPQSRSLIYFLYGTDKAKKLDEYFLKNFESDPNYAKVQLVSALRAFRERILFEYAARMEARRRRLAEGQSTSALYRLISVEDAPKQQGGQQQGQQAAQQGDQQAGAQQGGQQQGGEDSKPARVKLELVKEVSCEMFRMGITIRLPDSLEYIVAPSKYKQPFPLRGSVAGLALTTRETIVMYRDESKRFRTEDNETVTPGRREIQRGFEEVNYLSYVVFPVISRIGDRGEFDLGIIHVDTKLFVAPPTPDAAGAWADGQFLASKVEGGKTIVYADMSPKVLRGHAAKLYDENDEAVEYLKRMTEVTVPLLELYLKCRQGTT